MFPLGNRAYSHFQILALGSCVDLPDKIQVVTTAPSLRLTFPIVELLPP